MKNFVLITGLIELVAGIVLFVSPGILPELNGESVMAITLARMYGAAAIAIAYYAFMVWKNFGPGPVKGFLKTFTVFHIGVAVTAYTGYAQGIPIFIGVVALHGLLAAITIYFLARQNPVD